MIKFCILASLCLILIPCVGSEKLRYHRKTTAGEIANRYRLFKQVQRFCVAARATVESLDPEIQKKLTAYPTALPILVSKNHTDSGISVLMTGRDLYEGLEIPWGTLYFYSGACDLFSSEIIKIKAAFDQLCEFSCNIAVPEKHERRLAPSLFSFYSIHEITSVAGIPLFSSSGKGSFAEWEEFKAIYEASRSRPSR